MGASACGILHTAPTPDTCIDTLSVGTRAPLLALLLSSYPAVILILSLRMPYGRPPQRNDLAIRHHSEVTATSISRDEEVTLWMTVPRYAPIHTGAGQPCIILMCDYTVRPTKHLLFMHSPAQPCISLHIPAQPCSTPTHHELGC